MTKPLRRTGAVLLSTAVIAGGAWLALRHVEAPVEAYAMVPVTRGDLLSTINATGTLEPEEVIDVGAQVAGQITSFGKDENGKPIDYGSAVKAGTVLAQIDPALYASAAQEARASLAQAQANVQRAEADLGQLKARLQQADSDWARAQELGPSNALAQSSYDGYRAAYDIARANVAVGDATLAQSKGALLEAQAALDHAQRNLGYCTIASPVQGVIIDRRVNIGQTVVASLNAPSLFLIAKDLRRMQVWVSVNEADIGSIHAGEPATFTVDAMPGRTFHGQVGKIRLNASMTQNVVIYTVEVNTDNSSGALLPYLTANVVFQVAKRSNVLLVPNAALRWNPPQGQSAPAARRPAPGGEPSGPGGTLWVRSSTGLQPIEVRTGLSDGRMTEIQGAGVRQGLEVVMGIEQARAAAPPAAAANPFTPQFRRGNQANQGSPGGRGSR